MNPGIEAARFVLAAAVVLFHWNGSLPTAYLAVDLFFVISGLVIGRRYEVSQRSGGSLAGFALGRAIRLYPLYLLGLAAGLVSHAVDPMVTHDWSYSLPGLMWRGLLLVPVLSLDARPVGIQSFPLDVPAWSLWCEVLANLLFGLLCRAPRWAMAVPLLLGLGVLVAATAAEPYFGGGGDGRTVLTGLGRIGFSFFARVLLARLPRVTPLFGRASGLALASLLAALLLYFRMTNPSDALSMLILLVALYPVLTLCIACCDFTGTAARLCVAAGSLSYALYIVHWPLQRMVRSLAAMAGVDIAGWYGPLGTAAILLLLTAVAQVATERFDRPVRRYLNALRGKPLAVAGSPGVR